MTRELKALVLLTAMLTPLACGAEKQEPKCSWDGVERVLAVGDVHGDCDQFVKLLRAGGVVNERNAWIGGKTHMVQVGDVLDRGPDSKKAMDLLRRLEKEAEKAGGRVHALVGNHEAMVASGYLTYMRRDELAALGGEDGIRKSFGPGGEYRTWLQSHNAVVRINNMLFVHGGIGPAYADEPIEKINKEVRTELAGGKADAGGILMAPDGPLWYRGYAHTNDAELEEDLEVVFKSFKVRHVIVGHTVSKAGIQTRCGGGAIMIDVGFSRTYVGGHPACLLIEKGKFFVVTPEGKRELPVRASPAPEAVGATR